MAIDNSIINGISSVGFPIICCILLFYFNKIEIEKLRETVENNTRIVEQLKELLNYMRSELKKGDNNT